MSLQADIVHFDSFIFYQFKGIIDMKRIDRPWRSKKIDEVK